MGRLRSNFNPLGSGSPYKKNESVVDITTAGTTTFKLKGSGKYQVTVIGAGGGGAAVKSSNGYAGSPGASGSGFRGVMKLSSGTYTATVGAGGGNQSWLDCNCTGGTGGTSTLIKDGSNIVSSPGGNGGHAWWRGGSSLATVGAAPTVNGIVISTEFNRSGNVPTGTCTNGGASSILSGTDIGKGGSSTCNGGSSWAGNGAPGCVKLVYLGG